MRKIILAATILGLVTATSSASAQGTGSWIGSLGGGVTFPMGNFGDAAKTGWHGGATLGYKPADSKWEWLADATYHHLPGKGTTVDSRDNLFVILGRANYWTGSKLYLLGGAGFMRDEFKATVGGISSSSNTTAFALSGGVGIALTPGLMLEGRVIDGFTDGGSTVIIPVTVKVRF